MIFKKEYGEFRRDLGESREVIEDNR